MFVASVLAGCGGGENGALAPIARETPQDQILRIAKMWESTWVDSGFHTPPSPIGVFETRVTSRLTFERDSPTGKESLAFSDRFKTSAGTDYTCQSAASTSVAVAFAVHGDEAAVEVRRPPLHLVRQCTPAGFPEPEFDAPAAQARFVLRGDQLLPLAPPTERRQYLPVQ